VLIGAAILIGLALVPVLRGDLTRIQNLRLRLVRFAVGALAIQIVIVSVLPGGDETLYAAIHIATYALLAVVLIANLRVPGMWLIGLGGLANALAIIANDGVMPARRAALELAGFPVETDVFVNSGHVEDANLWWLGDVFAVPAGVPLANVFSVGDLLIALGGIVLVHRVCASRLPWRKPAGPALVLFDASGAVEAVTPEAGALLRRLGLPGIANRSGIPLPAEAFVVAGRARARALGRSVADAEASVLDRHGRPVRLTATCLGARVALSVAWA
jgi:hypothetical protein